MRNGLESLKEEKQHVYDQLIKTKSVNNSLQKEIERLRAQNLMKPLPAPEKPSDTRTFELT